MLTIGADLSALSNQDQRLRNTGNAQLVIFKGSNADAHEIEGVVEKRGTGWCKFVFEKTALLYNNRLVTIGNDAARAVLFLLEGRNHQDLAQKSAGILLTIRAATMLVEHLITERKIRHEHNRNMAT